LVPVHGHSVLYGSLQQLFVTIRRYRDGAIHFAWKFTTVYVLARHDDLPEAFSMMPLSVASGFTRRTQIAGASLAQPNYTPCRFPWQVAPARGQGRQMAAAGSYV